MKTQGLGLPAALGLALLGLAALRPSAARAADNVEIVSAGLSSPSPCVGDNYTLTVVLQDLTSTAFTPYLYVTTQFASVGCGTNGFNTSDSGPEIAWAVQAGTNPSTPGLSAFPNNGGWVAPVPMSYTGQTETLDFTVEIPGWDDADSGQDFMIGASSGYQEASGADSYYCLPYTTCPSVGSMVPTSTDSPTPAETATPSPPATPTPTPTPASGSPTPSPAETASPSPTAADGTSPQPSPTAAEPCGLTVRPNFIRVSGSIAITAQNCATGIATLRLLRQNGNPALPATREYLAAGQDLDFTWTGTLGDGQEAPSGIYYVVFTQGNGRSTLQKILVVR